ncbi:MAG: mercury methylation corrinoid protein HgcA [Deltaproteobacteria bacterium]|nr:mercury methylation corrinoid protein HgcA [Deltaproteobacteria bacterium]
MECCPPKPKSPKAFGTPKATSCCPPPAEAASAPKATTSEWALCDRYGAVMARLSNRFRMNYSIEPGLYSIGTPSKDSHVFVTANYKLSFDVLRRELKGINAHILVLDTKGINVWCAAGKGTFGTEELVTRIFKARLGSHVSHGKIIVPLLGAPGVAAHEVKRQTGFHVIYGPANARDIKAFIDNNMKTTPKMRVPDFGYVDRLVLTPMEFIPALKTLPYVAAFLFIIAGIGEKGFLYADATDALPLVILSLATIFTGALITPVILPLVPIRSFALKGLITGILATFGVLYISGISAAENTALTVFAYAFFPAVSSYLALQFTGATAYTNKSGVAKELKYALPLYKAAIAVSALSLITHIATKGGTL